MAQPPDAAALAPAGADLWSALAPELALVGTLLALLLAPFAIGRDARRLGFLALAGVSLAGWLAWTDASSMPVELFGRGGLYGGMVVIDGLTQFLRLLLLGLLAGVIGLWFLWEAPTARAPVEYLTLLISSALGMLFMASGSNLLLIVIAIELASLPSYALTAINRRDRAAAEAGLKYAIFGAAIAGFTLYGVSILGGLYGTLHAPSLVAEMCDSWAHPAMPASLRTLAVIGLLTLFAGVGFKLAVVPFHFWCPDVFTAAPRSVATWFSISGKVAAVALLLRLTGALAADPLAGAADGLPLLVTQLLAGCAALTMTFANLAAYAQRNVRRLLAYSSIAHAGTMMAAAAIMVRDTATDTALTDLARSAVVQYMLIYAVMNFAAFLALGMVAQERDSEDLDAFDGLAWRDPGVAAVVALVLFSLIGLPPLAGFVAKFWLIWAIGHGALAHFSAALWLLNIAIVLNTALSLFYYVNLIRRMYLRIPAAAARLLAAPATARLALYACGAALLVGGTLAPGTLKRWGDRVASVPIRTLEAAHAPAPARAPDPAP